MNFSNADNMPKIKLIMNTLITTGVFITFERYFDLNLKMNHIR